MMLPQEHDAAYRRFYYWLHALVDREIGRVLERFETSQVRYDAVEMMKELRGAARSLRVLTDYLERHPEALIQGKSGGSGR